MQDNCTNDKFVEVIFISSNKHFTFYQDLAQFLIQKALQFNEIQCNYGSQLFILLYTFKLFYFFCIIKHNLPFRLNMFPYQMPFFNPFLQNQILTKNSQQVKTRLTQKLGEKYEFSLQQKIGSGLTGDVYLGINKQTSELVCIKVIDRLGFVNQKQKTMLEHEIKCQELVQSDYTVKILDVFDTSSFCFIVTQLCEGGDLYKLIKMTKSGLAQNVAIKLGRQIALALKRLKQMQIIHRDIKCQNILLRHGDAKLGDYGFAIEESNLQTQEPFNLGSPIYMSLEALEQNKYSFASDIFAFGIVFYQMLHKLSPWECQTEEQLIQNIKTKQIRFKQGLNEQIRNIIRRCLERDVEKRITIEQILESKIFKQIQSQKKVTQNPNINMKQIIQTSIQNSNQGQKISQKLEQPVKTLQKSNSNQDEKQNIETPQKQKSTKMMTNTSQSQKNEIKCLIK